MVQHRQFFKLGLSCPAKSHCDDCNGKNVIGWTIMSLLVSAVIFAFFKKYELNRHYAITVGQVTEMTGTKHGDYGLNYVFEVNGEKHSGSVDMNLCGTATRSEVRQYVLHKNFPVAYDTRSPWVCAIILTLENAERFKVKMPDSLYPCLRHIDCDYYSNF